MTHKELIKKGKNADAIISLLTDKIDSSVIDQLKKCKVIANYAVGYNNIDIEYAKSKGIVVTNTPDILTDATADLAVSLVLACARKIVDGEKFMRSKKFKGWEPQLFLGVELKGKTVGIIGAGRIGQATAKRLKAFGTEIIYYSRKEKPEFEIETGATKSTLNSLLKNSDIISLHIPLTKETENLLNADKLKLLKPNAILINTARGEVLDEKYLIKMLKKKKIHSAGFDVYEGEPKVNKELLKLDNVVLLPHLGSATTEARTEMAELCAENVHRVLKENHRKLP
ncbi:MAG: D-glycerate dehydrogenase [Melioribacteraceae bacterium]|nr:D-glycerate dehydrogenase [Melioribacteraceae bacterium]